MSARRCSSCSINWPAASTFLKCPDCQEETWFAMDTTAISEQETNERLEAIKDRAERIAAHEAQYKAFDVFYADREVEQLRQELDEFCAQPTW